MSKRVISYCEDHPKRINECNPCSNCPSLMDLTTDELVECMDKMIIMMHRQIINNHKEVLKIIESMNKRLDTQEEYSRENTDALRVFMGYFKEQKEKNEFWKDTKKTAWDRIINIITGGIVIGIGAAIWFYFKSQVGG